MKLPVGAEYYLRRNHPDNGLDRNGGTGPIFVKHKPTGMRGFVTRATPSGNGIPPQAHILFTEPTPRLGELWCPLTDLARA